MLQQLSRNCLHTLCTSDVYQSCSVASCHKCYQWTKFNDTRSTSWTTIDVLLLKSTVKMSSVLQCHYEPLSEQRQCSKDLINATEMIKSELIHLLQEAAVEHLTAYRWLQAQQFGSVVTIVTTDFEALYAYKLDDYQRCLQLSAQNVNVYAYC